MALYDFVYADLNKVISVYSQLTGGIIEVIERSGEHTKSGDNKRHYDFKIFKHDAGGTTGEKNTSKETIKPHHALLTELEDVLAEEGYLVDLTDPNADKSLRDQGFRHQLKNAFCIKVTGRCVIEDYERIKVTAAAFPEVVKLINQAAEASLTQSPEYQQLMAQLDEKEKGVKKIKDSAIRGANEREIREARESLRAMLSGSAVLKGVDQWILDGMKTMIDTFLPGIINLRVYPSDARPDEHILGNLKRRCFEDVETNSFHYSYGSLPTERLTLLGIVTSVPTSDMDGFKPLVEFDRLTLADEESFENGLRGVFRGFDGMENMIRTCRFPRVMVYPLTVYRSVEASPQLKKKR